MCRKCEESPFQVQRDINRILGQFGQLTPLARFMARRRYRKNFRYLTKMGRV